MGDALISVKVPPEHTHTQKKSSRDNSGESLVAVAALLTLVRIKRTKHTVLD